MFKIFEKPSYTDNEITIVLNDIYGNEPDEGIIKTLSFDIKPYGKDIKMGYIDLRVGDSAYLYYMGNIGYRIEEKYRGHNYASKAVKLVLNQAIKENMKSVIITCSPENMPSYKTLVNCKAKLIETVEVPQWHELYKRGEMIKCIFKIDLDGIKNES